MTFIQRTARLLLASLLTLGATPALADEIPATRMPVLPSPAVAPLPAAAAQPAFTSLAAAVAAQDGLAEDEHLRCLAGAVYFESRGQPLAGQLAVAQVILNRIRSGRFADTPCGVVLQRGQFGFVRDGAIPAVNPASADYRTAVAVARVALAEAWAPTAGDALYFNGVRASHSGSRRIATIGGHAFYR